jgi:ribosomal-protein-alanine acetyltransferase
LSDKINTLLHRRFTLSDGTPCELKNFCRDDLDAIYQLEQRAHPYPWSKQNFQDSIANSHVCVGIQNDGEWIAQAVFSIASGDAELLIISVDPSWQSKGVAKQLLSLMTEVLEDFAAELFLEVRASNSRAIKLYDTLGFNCVGTRPGYYPSKNGREDAQIYGISLRIG